MTEHRYVNVEVLRDVLSDADPDEASGYAVAWAEDDGPDAVLLYVTDEEGETFFTRYQLTADGEPSFKVAYTEETGEVMVELHPMEVGA